MQKEHQVALYIRVSTEDQIEGHSLAGQETMLRNDAKLRGKLVYRVYQDAINVKIIMNTFAHIKMYIFNLQQASYGLLIYKTFLKLKLHGNDEGFYPKLHLQQLHHKKYHPMN